MVDASCDSWSKPLFASPETLFEATGDAERWAPRVVQAITSRFPELTAGTPCWPNDTRQENIRCFDIPFYDSDEPSWRDKLKRKS